MAVVDFLATEPQYAAHLVPIWHALPIAERGTFHVDHRLAVLLAGEGITATVLRGAGPPRSEHLTVVASWADGRLAHRAGRPVCLVEHGAGQRYEGVDHPSYSGGPEHEGTVLFLGPSETVMDRWRCRYPAVSAVAVGCPRLDGWHIRTASRATPADGGRGTVAAVAFHSDLALCPETRSGLWSFLPGLPDAARQLAASGVTLVGHAHPRLWRRAAPLYERCGIEPVESFDEVLGRADVLAADNSSALPEFCSLGRPVVWMNAPHFRRGVHHGGRFWQWPAGQVSCDEPDRLAASILAALDDPPEVQEARARMTEAVYAYTDGRAAERAVAAIRDVAS